MPIIYDGFFMVRHNQNLMPMKLVDGVALKTLASKNLLSRFQGVKRKLLISFRILSAVYVVVYLLGYQPVIGFPPIQKAVVHGQSTSSAEQQAQNASIVKESFSKPFQLPHPGYQSSQFSSWHPGIDIADGLGATIHPIQDGKVVEATYGFFGLGHYVVIEHEQGYRSTYGHMGRIFVKPGDEVTEDSIIGEIGMTGRTSGPHTHLEIRKDGKPIDPLMILPPISNIPLAKYLGNATGSANISYDKPYSTEKSNKEERKIDLKKELRFSL